MNRTPEDQRESRVITVLCAIGWLAALPLRAWRWLRSHKGQTETETTTRTENFEL